MKKNGTAERKEPKSLEKVQEQGFFLIHTLLSFFVVLCDSVYYS